MALTPETKDALTAWRQATQVLELAEARLETEKDSLPALRTAVEDAVQVLAELEPDKALSSFYLFEDRLLYRINIRGGIARLEEITDVRS